MKGVNISLIEAWVPWVPWNKEVEIDTSKKVLRLQN